MYSSSFLHVVCYASCEVVTCHIVCYVVSCISFVAVTDLAVTKLTLVGDATDIDISVTEVLRISLKVALVSGSGWPTNDLLKPLFHFKFLLSSKYRHLRCLSHKFTDDIILLLAAYRQHKLFDKWKYCACGKLACTKYIYNFRCKKTSTVIFEILY